MDGRLAGAVPHLRAPAGRQVSRADVTDLPMRRNNLRTALVLASIVLVFFVGIVVRRWLIGN